MNGDGALHRLAANGFVVRFWRRSVLAEAVAALRAERVHVVALDAGAWADEAAMHTAVTAALGFPAYYGRNLDALADCLGDVADGSYGTPPGATGLALVLDGYDAFAAREPRVAQAVLDIVANAARLGWMWGHPTACLVRVDDASYAPAPVGATAVGWNQREWFDDRRGTGAPPD